MTGRARVLAYAAAAFAVAAALYAYAGYVSGLGFPDGFVSEAAAAERVLAIAFIGVSMGFALVLAWLGARPSRAAAAAVAALYGVVVAAAVGADYVLRASLMGGGGG